MNDILISFEEMYMLNLIFVFKENTFMNWNFYDFLYI